MQMAEFIVVAVCLLLNALVACFEMAFVTVSKPELRALAKKGSGAAKTLLSQRENPERTLSVVQIGITMVGMISAAVGGAGAEEALAPFFENRLGLSENMAEAMAIGCVVLPLTYFSVVFGELVPKAIALRNPIGISIAGARWSKGAERVLGPFVAVLEFSTKITLALLPKHRTREEAAPATIELETLTQQSQGYVLNLVRAETRRVNELMVPWNQVQSVDEADTPEGVMQLVLASGHTRVPVMRKGDVVGILHSKEFMAYSAAAPQPWFSLVRPVVILREDDLALRALRTLQAQRSHLGVVLARDNRPVGIVTIADIMEEVFGEVYDEDDDGRVKKLFLGNPRFRGIVSKL